MAPIFDLTSVHNSLDVLLAQSPSPTTFEASLTLDRRIPQVFETLRAIASVQAKLEILRATARSWHGPLPMISSMPNEIIMKILEYSVSDEEAGPERVSWRASVRISHVCSLWRKLSLAQSRLWTCISVASEGQTHLFKLFLARSRSRALHLEVIGSSCHRGMIDEPSFCLNPPSAALKQVASLRLHGIWADGCLFPIGGFPPIDIPRIIISRALLEFETLMLFEGAEELSLTHTSMAIPSINFHYNSLRTLTFQSNVCAEVVRFLKLARLPALRSLAFTSIDAKWEAEGAETVPSWDMVHAGNLANLESLTIDSCCPEVWEGLSDVSVLRPRYLRLVVSDRWDPEYATEQIYSFLFQCGDAIRTLHLTFDPTNVGGIAGLTSSSRPPLCPRLERLHVDFPPHRHGKHRDPSLDIRPAVLATLENYLALTKGSLHLTLGQQLYEVLNKGEEWYQNLTQEFTVCPE